MNCNICGTEENINYSPNSRQVLCITCNIMTPKKVSKETFRKEYFKNEKNIQKNIVNEFYDDYIKSILTLKEYIAETVEKET